MKYHQPTLREYKMSIARIQIDFGMLPDENLSDLLTLVGDMVMHILDDHEEDEPCVRYVSIEAAEVSEDEYEIGFTADEENDLLVLGVPESWTQGFNPN